MRSPPATIERPGAELDGEDFGALIEADDRPVRVAFWAPGCGPGRQLAPVIEALATERPDALRVITGNVDDRPELARRCGVRSIPAVLVVRGGKAVESIVGAAPKARLEAVLEAAA